MLKILLGFYKAVLAAQVPVVHNSKVFISFIILIIFVSALLIALTKIVRTISNLEKSSEITDEESFKEKDIDILKARAGVENNLNQVMSTRMPKSKKNLRGLHL